ncbi:unnamed protein product [Timema podura]|uniref:Uncharacterized protein n=1 Tax=Timema podura TaxID=61482 RepID=A0ABN7NRE1_TIMPD|nr:unnamed protein product [Timema podura]
MSIDADNAPLFHARGRLDSPTNVLACQPPGYYLGYLNLRTSRPPALRSTQAPSSCSACWSKHTVTPTEARINRTTRASSTVEMASTPPYLDC